MSDGDGSLGSYNGSSGCVGEGMMVPRRIRPDRGGVRKYVALCWTMVDSYKQSKRERKVAGEC